MVFPQRLDTGVDDRRVIAGFPAGADFNHRLIDAQGGPIGPVRGHGLDHIGDGDDPGRQQDFVMIQSGG